MSSDLKHTPIGYFKYFYHALGIKLIYNIFLAVILGLLDGLGLALFIPLLQFVNSAAPVESDSMGGLSFVIKGFAAVGVPLNLVSVLSLMVIIFVIKGLFNYRLSMEQVDLRQKYMISLRLNQIEDLKNLSYQGFLKLESGQIQNGVTAEIGKNIQALIQFLSSTKAVILLSCYIILAFIANWKFAILILIGGYLSSFLFKGITERVKASSLDISKRGNLFSGYIIQAVHSFKYLKATNQYSNFALKLKRVINEVEQLNRRIGHNQALSGSSREPVIIIIVSIVIIVQISFMGSSLGSILLSLLLFYRALNGLVAVQLAWQNFMQNIGGLQSIADLRVAMQAEREIQTDVPYPGFSKEIALNKVTFSYGNNKVLDNIDILIPKNKTIAFVGESGSGKSTLANIITTLLKHNEGQLLIDGTDIYSYNLDSFRNSIGYITQDPIIFSDNIYNNVTFWSEPTEDNVKRFWDVIKQVSLMEFMDNLSERENTMMGDNGVLVSGGQKQRISIARELFKQVDILIMDEATSALDSQTERFIQNSIDDLKGEYTMIVIAHRLSTIKNADIIYLIDKGKVSASGNYDQLLIDSMRFQKMVSLQHV